mmetsp:Transcript_22970/g.76153  ORF Transcript_22970/g.76153 Transcript_22970/m.76153 type:complete len:200 (+) Transcript_22970:2515-3114(+)
MDRRHHFPPLPSVLLRRSIPFIATRHGGGLVQCVGQVVPVLDRGREKTADPTLRGYRHARSEPSLCKEGHVRLVEHGEVVGEAVGAAPVFACVPDRPCNLLVGAVDYSAPVRKIRQLFANSPAGCTLGARFGPAASVDLVQVRDARRPARRARRRAGLRSRRTGERFGERARIFEQGVSCCSLLPGALVGEQPGAQWVA